MTEKTALAEAILKHWREHKPQMVRDLKKRGDLDRAVSEAETRTADLIHELVAVRRMEYHAAWELAIREWALPPEEAQASSGRRPPRRSKQSRSPKSRRPRATSA